MANDYHEPAKEMSEKDREIIRATQSLIEEIEAVGWYHQRCAVTEDEELKAIMWHNAVEEMEHAMMALEWLRRNQDGWDEQMRTFLFAKGSIMEAEEHGEEENEEKSSSSDDLGIGQL